ncbi:TRAP transporter small permease [Bacillus mesophilum]|uniref:TRAP transporter small permease n=1 Tax=Bacillus mesophilum TaxID=1071718 RepID=A0A7V7RKX9_9BACI|nr:TRAP transporter small permease [Bacillus mesophilum]KAB2331988.1 TRAP transporter small permease [Bacillus mesophilum]
MKLIKTILDKILGSICIILFAFLVLLVTWQVITRFIFDNPSVISEELAKYCFVWLVLFGAAYVFGERGHMAIEFIKDKFPSGIKMGVELFIELVVILFAALILVQGGFAATSLAWTQLSGALQIPVGYLYSAIPLSGVFIIFYCIYNMYLIIKNKKPLEQ